MLKLIPVFVPPLQIDPELTNTLLEAGVVATVVVIVFSFLIIFSRMILAPMVKSMLEGQKATSDGFEHIMALGKAQHQTVELWAKRLQQALDREEALTEKLRAENLMLQADVARLEIRIQEQTRLRDEDFKRIKLLESAQVADKQAIEDLKKNLRERDNRISMLMDELDAVKRQRETVAKERDERDTVIVGMQAQIDNLSTRLKTQEQRGGDHDKQH